jgi:DNA-binding winged helix-turn-helix (wHTH) protein/TolB-like protein/tetratricopeptide (TPR) repeat protein
VIAGWLRRSPTVAEPERQDAPIYRFEDVRVDTRARRVFRAGQEVPLEPKAYAVLLALLREPQVAIPRDRLLDEVWGHRYVTPAVLSRVIVLLRRALGDEADHPRLIRTVHGVGYSFIGTLAPADVPVEPSPGDPVAAFEIADAPRDAEATMAGAAQAPRAHVGWLVGASAVLVAVAWWAVAGRNAEAPSPPPPAAAQQGGVRLAILPIEAANPGDAVVARGLTDLLNEMLGRSGGFALTALESTRLAAARAGDPVSLGALLGTDFLLRGRMVPAGPEVEVSLELLRVSDGAALWRESFRERRDGLVAVLGAAVAAVRRELQPASGTPEDDPVLLASVAVQSLYLRSRQQWQGTPTSRADHLALLEQAVAKDPGFAIGWVAIADARRRSYHDGDASLDEAMRGAREAVDRALALEPDLVEALLVACWIATNQWRSSEALGPSRRALELAPNDARVLATRGNVLGYLGRPLESLELRRRSAALNPLSWYTRYAMAIDYTLLGRREEAIEAIERGIAASGETADSSAVDVRVELAFGNPAAALLRPRDPLLSGLPRRGIHLYEAVTRAQALSLIGETRAAEAELATREPRLPEAPIYVDGHLYAFWSDGRYAESLRWLLNEGRGAAQHPWQTVAVAHARALVGDTAAALADYASALEGPADRDLVFHNWFPTRFGPAQLANWIALRKAAGLEHAAELADYAARLERASEGGTAIPVIEYHRAALAALRDDPVGADAALRRARDRGWFDPIALEVDLAWRPHRGSDWLDRHREALAAKAAAERARFRRAAPG